MTVIICIVPVHNRWPADLLANRPTIWITAFDLKNFTDFFFLSFIPVCNYTVALLQNLVSCQSKCRNELKTETLNV